MLSSVIVTVGCTKSEPEPGWLENMNGPTGIIAPIIVGFLRTIPIATDKITDIIPVDYTANALISVMWDTVNRYLLIRSNPIIYSCDVCILYISSKRDTIFRYEDPDTMTKEPKIYNYVSSVESPLSWGTYIKEMHHCYREVPPLRSMWYIFYIFYTTLWVGKMLRFVLHRVPAAFMDVLLIFCGKSPK